MAAEDGAVRAGVLVVYEEGWEVEVRVVCLEDDGRG